MNLAMICSIYALGHLPVAEFGLFYFLFRVFGLFVLAVALVMAVLDITRSITATAVILTPLLDSWAAINPSSLLGSQKAVETWLHPVFWDPIVLFFLKLPGWLVLWLIAMFFLWMGQRRETPFGRFASR